MNSINADTTIHHVPPVQDPFHNQSLFLGNGALFRYVDSIKELTKILVSDTGGLLDLCCGETDCHNIVSTELKLILNICGPEVFNTIREQNLAHALFAKEVTDLDILSSGVHIDGEMRVNEAHLVAESLRDTYDHVLNVGAHGADAGELLAVGEPNVDTNMLLTDFAQVHAHMLEVAFEGATLACDGHSASVDFALDTVRDLYGTGG